MFARVNFVISGHAEKSPSGSFFPADDEARDVFRKLGIELTKRLETGPLNRGQYTLEKLEPVGSKVDLGSTPHYRDLAIRNLSSSTPQQILKEMTSHGIFFGVSSEEQTKIFISRPQEGAITFFFYNRDASKAMKTLNSILPKIMLDKMFQSNDGVDRDIQVFTCESGVNALSGKYSKRSIADTIKRSPIEVAVLCFCLAVGILAFGVDTAFAVENGVDPLSIPVRKFVSGVWPSMAVSVLTLSVTVLLIHFRSDRHRVTWK
jgi:hypothetical protein